jgi:hypothetical protein
MKVALQSRLSFPFSINVSDASALRDRRGWGVTEPRAVASGTRTQPWIGWSSVNRPLRPELKL